LIWHNQSHVPANWTKCSGAVNACLVGGSVHTHFLALPSPPSPYETCSSNPALIGALHAYVFSGGRDPLSSSGSPKFSGIWTWVVLLGAKEIETNHIPPSPPHAAGLPPWVRPIRRRPAETENNWVMGLVALQNDRERID
jgi:hypothetical protein